MSCQLDERLLSAAGFVRAGAVLADIGTDHGYLPVFLLSRGDISRAVLCDINAGPLASARANVEAAGLSDLAELVLTDGARGIAGRGVTDYAVCGMGGELIADILSASPHMAEAGVRLILQPMTKQEHLRRYLACGGFVTVGERYTSAEGKFYLTIAAEYSGEKKELSLLESYLGACPIVTGDEEAYVGYLKMKLVGLRRALDGRRCAGGDCSVEQMLCDKIAERITSLGGKC